MRPKTYIATDHDVDPSRIDADALYVIRKLKDAGHTAYIVGGCVRDLLTGHTPKDLDISTSAQPEEIKKIFRRQCLLIGRRFRLAHIRFGQKIIEVATFRSGDNESDLIIRDNTWGTAEEDALRRDFTINGLLLDPTTHEIIDYVGGWEDVHKRLLRSIGDPIIRFKQDPVRMIRLLKFRARFGFKISPDAKKALLECSDEITKSSPARLLEEILRMLESGASAPFFSLLKESGFMEILFPMLTPHFKGKSASTMFDYLTTVDEIHKQAENKTLDRSILVGCLLQPLLEMNIKRFAHGQGRPPHLGEVHTLSTTLIREFVRTSFVQIPKRISAITNQVMTSQYRFVPLSGKVRFRSTLFQNHSFPLSLDFLKIRSLVDESLGESYEEWKNKFHHFQQQHDHRGHHNPPPKKRRRRRRKSH